METIYFKKKKEKQKGWFQLVFIKKKTFVLCGHIEEGHFCKLSFGYLVVCITELQTKIQVPSNVTSIERIQLSSFELS